MKFLDNVANFSCFSAPLPDCLCHVSFRRYSPLSVKVVEKPNKCKSFLAPIFPGETTPTVLQQIVSAINHPPFGKVWLSSVCWSQSAKPGNDVETRIYRRPQKCGVWAPICRGRGYPRFWIAVTSEPCGRFWLSSVQQARRLGGEKKKERKKNPW